MEQPGLEEETVHEAKVDISRKYGGGGSRFGRELLPWSGDPGKELVLSTLC